VTVDPPLLDRLRLYARQGRRQARRRVLLWVIEHAPPGDLTAVVETAQARLRCRAAHPSAGRRRLLAPVPPTVREPVDDPTSIAYGRRDLALTWRRRRP
jgi:hypothetical protein